MTDRAACRNHPDRSHVARCGECGFAMCDECWRFRVNERPGCARCAYEATTRRARRMSLAVYLAGASVAGLIVADRRYALWTTHPAEVLVGAGVAALLTAAIALSGVGTDPSVERREADEPAPEPSPVAAPAYRASARRVLLAAAPKVSGRATALVMLACFAAAAVLLPASLRLPRWVEAEAVLLAWWAIVGVTLTALLYRGFRLRDDVVYFTPWNRPPADRDNPGVGNKLGDALSGCGSGGCDPGCGDIGGCGASGCGELGEGLLVGAAVLVALAVAFGAAWVLVEVALPLVFFLMFALFMRAIGRVANDRHGCEGSLPRALGWGLGWATVYVAPVALATWALHALHR
ncbi:MAG: hypothetical protein R3A52_28125 [Polyangiales bacterium]